jgi:hypothetical protein
MNRTLRFLLARLLTVGAASDDGAAGAARALAAKGIAVVPAAIKARLLNLTFVLFSGIYAPKLLLTTFILSQIASSLLRESQASLND